MFICGIYTLFFVLLCGLNSSSAIDGKIKNKVGLDPSDPSWFDIFQKFSDFMRTQQRENGDLALPNTKTNTTGNPPNLTTTDHDSIPGSSGGQRGDVIGEIPGSAGQRGGVSGKAPLPSGAQISTDATDVVTDIATVTSLVTEVIYVNDTTLPEKPFIQRVDDKDTIVVGNVGNESVTELWKITNTDRNGNNASGPFGILPSSQVQNVDDLKSKGEIRTKEPLPLQKHGKPEGLSSVKAYTESQRISPTNRIMDGSENNTNTLVPTSEKSVNNIITVEQPPSDDVHSRRKPLNSLAIDTFITQYGPNTIKVNETALELSLTDTLGMDTSNSRTSSQSPLLPADKANTKHNQPIPDSVSAMSPSTKVAPNNYIGDTIWQKDWEIFDKSKVPSTYKMDDDWEEADDDDDSFRSGKDNQRIQARNITKSECSWMSQWQGSRGDGLVPRLLQHACHSLQPLPLMFLLLMLATLAAMCIAICRLGHRVCCGIKGAAYKDSDIERGDSKEKKSLLGV